MELNDENSAHEIDNPSGEEPPNSDVVHKEFNELLGVDDKPTRELDMWLSKQIAGGDDHKELLSVTEVLQNGEEQAKAKNYTTTESIDSIWTLAKQYFDQVEIRTDSINATPPYTCDYYKVPEIVGSVSGNISEQVTIAEALFNAYHERRGVK
jgi:hypothetical protein